jgi:class 3 adenylate cyclase
VRELLGPSGLIDDIHDVDKLQIQTVRLKEEQYLCRKGDTADCLWVVRDGLIAVRGPGGTVVTRGVKDVIGEQGLLEPHNQRGADLQAIAGSAELLQLGRAALEAHPEKAALYRNLARIVSKKLTQATEERVDFRAKLQHRDAQLERYVGWLGLSENALFSGGARRSWAAVMFSDVVGFSRLTRDTTPGDAAKLVQRFLAPQVKAIESHGGAIDKFMGDGVMALWPATETTKTPVCVAALQAAEEALAGVRAIPVEGGHLDLRIGLHIGEVVLGDFGTAGRAQFTAIGADVNLAARLEQMKEFTDKSLPGVLRASEAFFQALPGEGKARLPLAGTTFAKNIETIQVHTSPREGT